MNSKILILSGGTGGHVIPSINFGNFLIKEGYECSLILDERGLKYSDIFKDFVPRTTYQITKMIQEWEKLGLIKSILNFKK